MNAIEVRQLTRTFGKTHAVDSITLDIAKGTVFGLLGPNGAGKSTLLNLLVGHLTATSGSATVLGEAALRTNAALWQKVGYASQSRYLPCWMTGGESLRFARAFHPTWDEPKVQRLVSRLDVPLNVRINDLSRGHYVRLQIVLALSHNPELILLDEPTSGLDPVGRRELLALLIEEIEPSAGRTVVFSSHLVEDVERMSDAVAIMDSGRIVATGPIDTLKGARGRVAFSNSVAEADLTAVPGLITIKREPNGSVAVTSEPDNAVRYLRSRGAADAAVVSVSFEQVFFDYVNRRQQ